MFHVKVEFHDQFDTFSFLMVQLRMHSEILTFMVEYSNKFRIHRAHIRFSTCKYLLPESFNGTNLS